jgi:hypothetical protein
VPADGAVSSSAAVDLARRLRDLRAAGLGGRRLSQARLGELLSGSEPLSAPLISSWERPQDPVVPPEVRLRAYARVFASDRSLAEGRMLDESELEVDERDRLIELEQELLELRELAVPTSQPDANLPASVAAEPPISAPMGRGSWRFTDQRPITIVMSELPALLREQLEYAREASPDYVDLYRYADLDAMVELYGHLRATNPQNTRIRFKTASALLPDDAASHLILIGGIDFNPATRDLLERLRLPVRQVSGDDRAVDGYFEVQDDTEKRHFAAQVAGSGADAVLREDVALFYRGPSPLNRLRRLTICNAMYGRGTFGAVRALTDAWFRDRNEEYLSERFGDATEVCLLFKVPIFAGNTVTPDWSDPEIRLFEWSR